MRQFFLGTLFFSYSHTRLAKCGRCCVLLENHGNTSLDNDLLAAHSFILQYVHYNPLHVSSITCSSSEGRIVFMQHLVSSSQSVAVRCTG